MSNIKNRIEMYYLDLKNKAEDIAERNLSIAKKNPEFKSVYDELAINQIQIGKAEAFGLSTSSQLLEQQKKLEQKYDKILAKLEIQKQQLLPQYTCKECNDTGILVTGKKCKCYWQLEAKLICEELGATNTNLYDFSAANAELNPNINFGVVKSFCEKFPNTKTKNFVFFGHTGCGKTFVAQSIASDLIQRGFSVVCISAFQLNKAFLRCINRENNSFNYDYNYLTDFLINCDMLVIDDLGGEPIMEKITLQNFLNVLSERLFKKNSFIITTNLDSQQLMERYGERVLSRLMNKQDTAFVNFYGKDIRINKKNFE